MARSHQLPSILTHFRASGQGIDPGQELTPSMAAMLTDDKGKPLLDYDLAIPNMLLHYFPSGMLGSD